MASLRQKDHKNYTVLPFLTGHNAENFNWVTVDLVKLHGRVMGD